MQHNCVGSAVLLSTLLLLLLQTTLCSVLQHSVVTQQQIVTHCALCCFAVSVLSVAQW
jgi:hypothetical protein